jgi:hypothetical protein
MSYEGSIGVRENGSVVDKVVELLAGFPRKRGFSNIDRDDEAVI